MINVNNIMAQDQQVSREGGGSRLPVPLNPPFPALTILSANVRGFNDEEKGKFFSTNVKLILYLYKNPNFTDKNYKKPNTNGNRRVYGTQRRKHPKE